MVPRPAALLLFLTFVLCVPLPYFLVAVGTQPVASLIQILLFTLTLIAAEGSSGAVVLAAGIVGVQVVLGLGVLAVATTIVIRLMDRALGRNLLAGTYVLVALIVAVACTQPIYRTPFRANGIRATLTQVFE
jgi:hypothetical protein